MSKLTIVASLAVCLGVCLGGRAFAEPEPISFDIGLSTGSWPDSVDLELPPAPRGTAPTVQLVADHAAVDGELGSGWRLIAGSKLTRHSEYDGVPNFGPNLFRLDGMDLVTPQGGTTSQPEPWDGSILTYTAGTNTWERKKEGWTWTYGSKVGTGTNATKLLANAGQPVVLPGGGNCATSLCKTSTWYLSKVHDPFGNVILYNYTIPTLSSALAAKYPSFTNSRQHLPLSIVYGAARVDFTYQDRPDPRAVSDNGRLTIHGKRLKGITTKVGSAKFSRYELQYEDETAAGALTAPLTDCDNNTVVAGSAPTQSLLRKIVRIGTGTGTAPTPQHTLRCLRTHHASFAWDAPEAVAAIDDPTPANDVTHEMALPIAINLDRDGVTDLVVIGIEISQSGSYTVTPRAYVATPDRPRAFAVATGTGDAAAVAALWEAQLSLRLTPTLFSDHRGYALTDLDGDREPELLWEDANGDVKIDRRDSFGGLLFYTSSTFLDGCDLRHGDFADIDGNGALDLVIRAHATIDGCLAEPRTRWIRGALVSSAAVTLAAPLEAAVPPAGWTSALAACPNGVSWPTDYNPDWDEAGYIASNVRIADFNDDGKADYAVALHACWDNPIQDDEIQTLDFNEAEWHPVGGSDFTQLFWGTGYGTFVASGLSAGPPLTYELDEAGSSGIVTGRILTGILAAIDLDRNGLSELMTTAVANEGTGAMINRSRGVVSGWGVTDEIFTNHPSTGGVQPSFMTYLSGAAECYHRAATQAIGDFDGDGFADVITFELDESGFSTCAAGGWCVNLRRSSRTATEGRMISSDGPWGGRTELQWGFTAQAPHDNPNLEVNLEVIETVDGAEGEVTLTYSGAFTTGRDPTPFAQVERRSERGGMDLFGYVLAPWAMGKPSHAARYRADGSLERATIYIHGIVANGVYEYSAARPYFNPLFRKCDYDVGHYSAAGTQSISLSQLLSACYGFAGGLPLPPTGEAGFQAVEDQKIPIVLGHTDGQLTPGSMSAYETSFGTSAHTFGSISVSDAWDYSAVGSASPTTGFLRWAVPPELASVIPAAAAAEAGYVYPIDPATTPYIELIDEWNYNYQYHQPLRAVEYRDTATLVDDRVHNLTTDQPDPAGHWYRQRQDEVTDRFGAPLAVQTRDQFVATYTPQKVASCGSNGTTCRTHFYTFDAAGDVATHTFPDGGSESWTRGTCGVPTQHRDPVLRLQTNTVSTACRITASSFEGATTGWVFDAIGRLTQTTVTPGSGAPPTVINHYYDDALAVREDASFVEPRIGTKRGDGQATLTYLDGFGRPTKEVECKHTATGSGTGVLANVRCENGTTRVTRFDLIGNDGLVKVRTDPYVPGETPATHGFAHDGFGRAIVALDPAHTTGPGWNATTYRRGSGWHSVTDATGRVARTDQTTIRRQDRLGMNVRSVQTFDVLGHVVDATAADGTMTRHTYDVLGEPATVRRLGSATCVGADDKTAPCSWQVSYQHDLGGRVIRETGPDGIATAYTYDALGRLTSTAIVDGATTTVIETRTYRPAAPAAPPQLDIIDESGAVTTVSTDGLGRVIGTELIETSEAVTWGGNGRPMTITDRNGRVTTLTYDTYDRVIRVAGPDGAIASLTYDGRGRVQRATDPDGVVVETDYNYSGLPASTTLDNVITTREQTYDAAGRVVTSLAGGVRSSYTYDGLGRLITTTRGTGPAPAEEVVALVYDAGDRVLSRTVTPAAADPAVTSFEYDAWGRRSKTTDPVGGEWIENHDVIGRIRLSLDPDVHLAITRYDARGRVIATKSSAGWVHTTYAAGASYDGIDQLTRVEHYDDQDVAESPTSRIASYVDGAGREVAVVDRNGLIRQSTWSGGELIARTWLDPSGTVLASREFSYDAAGRLAVETGPFAPSDPVQTHDYVTYTYTPGGRVQRLDVPEQSTAFTYLHGLVRTEAWDDQLRTLERAEPDATWVTAETLRGSTGAVRTRTITRDQLGRSISETVAAPDVSTVTTARAGFTAHGGAELETRMVAGVTEATTDWDFDLAGRPVARTVTAGGAAAATTMWVWTPGGALAERLTPSGRRIGYEYDAGGLLARVFDASGFEPDYAVVVSRDLRGQLTELDVPIESEAREFGYSLGLASSRSTGPVAGATTLAWTADERDLFGRLIQDSFTDAIGSWTNTYAYNGRGRLVEETRGRAGEHRRHSWSPGGNHLLVEMFDGSTFNPVMTAEYAGQKLTAVDGIAIAYDPWQATLADQHGNQLTYTADGEVRTITGPAATPVTVIRDATGIPVVHLEGGTPRQLTWGLDASDTPIEIVASDGTVRTYVNAEGHLVGTLTSAVGDFTSAERDERGSLVRWDAEVTGDDSAFGEGAIPPPTGGERFLFAGLESVAGAVDLHLARHRVYDAHTGRFQSPDPIGLAGGMHRFLYAEGDPIRNRDPLGWSSCLPVAGGGAPTIDFDPLETHTYDFEDSGVDGYSVGDAVQSLMSDQTIHATSGAFDIDLSPSSPCGNGVVACDPGPGDGDPIPMGAAGTQALGGGAKEAAGEAEPRLTRRERKAEEADDANQAAREAIGDVIEQDCETIFGGSCDGGGGNELEDDNLHDIGDPEDDLAAGELSAGDDAATGRGGLGGGGTDDVSGDDGRGPSGGSLGGTDDDIELDDGLDLPDLITPKVRPWTQVIERGPWGYEKDLQKKIAEVADDLGLPNTREVSVRPDGMNKNVRLDHGFDVEGIDNTPMLEVKRDVDGPRAGPTVNQKAAGIPDSPKDLDVQVRGEKGRAIELKNKDLIKVDVDYMNPVDDDIGGYIHDLAVRNQLGKVVDGNTAKTLSRIGHGASKGLGVLGIVPTVAAMASAAKESYDNGDVRPFIGQGIREGVSWGVGEAMGVGGAALGAVGGPIGSAVGYFGGSTLGGAIGYELADRFVDALIWDDEAGAAPQ